MIQTAEKHPVFMFLSLCWVFVLVVTGFTFSEMLLCSVKLMSELRNVGCCCRGTKETVVGFNAHSIYVWKITPCI